MNTSLSALTRCLGPFLLALLLGMGAVAESDDEALASPLFDSAELEQMLAPIALYPDALLSQILMAATYPVEVADAARWSRKNSQLEGEAAVKAVEHYDWDPSITSLVAFPQILRMMDDKMDWTERLGDAFIAQRGDVMAAIQDLRRTAQREGHLVSGDYVRVVPEDRVIIVESRDPRVWYLPYYDPRVVYGHWQRASHPPVYWDPWPGYSVLGGFGWGRGVGVGVSFFFGSLNWRDRNVYTSYSDDYYQYHRGATIRVYNIQPRVWHHDHHHRRGVPYWDGSPRRPFERDPARYDRERYFYGDRDYGDRDYGDRDYGDQGHGDHDTDRDDDPDHDRHGRGRDDDHEQWRDRDHPTPPAGFRVNRDHSGDPRVPQVQPGDRTDRPDRRGRDDDSHQGRDHAVPQSSPSVFGHDRGDSGDPRVPQSQPDTRQSMPDNDRPGPFEARGGGFRSGGDQSRGGSPRLHERDAGPRFDSSPSGDDGSDNAGRHSGGRSPGGFSR